MACTAERQRGAASSCQASEGIRREQRELAGCHRIGDSLDHGRIGLVDLVDFCNGLHWQQHSIRRRSPVAAGLLHSHIMGHT